MTSREEMVQRVGEDLSLVPIGQALEAQDAARIDKVFDEIYARIKDAGYATWSLTSDLPDKVVPYFTLMMLEKLMLTYSVPAERFQRIQLSAGPNGDTAFANLAKVVTREYESLEDVTDF